MTIHRWNQPAYVFCAVSTILLLAGCPAKDLVQAPKTVQSRRVAATSYALQCLTQEIAGNSNLVIECVAARAIDPQEWSPNVDEIIDLQSADLLVGNGPGANYANWLTRITFDKSKYCNSVNGFELKDFLKVKDHQIVHSHGPEGEHSHPYFVPYTWLDPSLAIKQAEEIYDSLRHIYPESEPEFTANLSALKAKLTQLKNQTSQYTGSSTVVCINPSMKFLTRCMGIVDSHLLYFAPSDINDHDSFRMELENAIGKNSTGILLTSYELPVESQEVVEELGLKVIKVDLMNRDCGIDFISMMKSNIMKLSALESVKVSDE